MRNTVKAAGLGLCVLLSTSAAQASGSAAAGLQAMRETNLIVLGDMSGGHDVEGKTFVGGNLTGNPSPFAIGNASQGEAISTRPTLTVGGTVTMAGVTVNNGSNGGSGTVATPAGIVIGGSLAGLSLNAPNAVVKVGGNLSNVNGSTGSNISYGGTLGGYANANGATFTHDSGLAGTLAADVAAQTAQLALDLKALSTELGGLTTINASIDVSNGADKPKFVTAAGSFAVFNITAAQLGGFSELNFAFAAGEPVIINVTGLSATYLANPVGGNSGAVNQQVIWNFVDATSIDFQRFVHGSVLAPFATIANNTPIEGSVAVANFNSNGEIHLGTYAGSDAFLTPPPPPPPPAVPEPASWALLIAGFGMVGGALRWRQLANA